MRQLTAFGIVAVFAMLCSLGEHGQEKKKEDPKLDKVAPLLSGRAHVQAPGRPAHRLRRQRRGRSNPTRREFARAERRIASGSADSRRTVVPA